MTKREVMISIRTAPTQSDVGIHVPGSKSYTHRTLIAAALSDGVCGVANPLRSEDTLLTLAGLRQMGIRAQERESIIVVNGQGGRFQPVIRPIDFGNSGTSMRLFGGLAILGDGPYTLTGNRRMRQRPMRALLYSLNQMGARAGSVKGDGCPPVIIEGRRGQGGTTTIDCSLSSQYLSALLLVGPCLGRGLTIEVIKGPVSRPYIDMTVDIMRAFGVKLSHRGYAYFEVPGGQAYRHGDYTVEPDASNAGYFWTSAAITGSRVKVKGLTAASRQGDVGLVEVLRQMGCRVEDTNDGIAVTGGALKGVSVNMGHMPDAVPTLAVAAAFAQGTTTIDNVAHLRAKECDRLAAVTGELAKMGIKTRATQNRLHVEGGEPRGAKIDTYDDHRIAMSFALAGLRVPGIKIKNPRCVAKSFPTFWEVFEKLYAR